jgi:hypothetical protein
MQGKPVGGPARPIIDSQRQAYRQAKAIVLKGKRCFGGGGAPVRHTEGVGVVHPVLLLVQTINPAGSGPAGNGTSKFRSRLHGGLQVVVQSAAG